MQPSTELCRSRAAYHHALADASRLENVRKIALAAELAWKKEGLLAVKREARVEAGKKLSPSTDQLDQTENRPASGPECD